MGYFKFNSVFSCVMQSRFSLCKDCTLCADTKATKVVFFKDSFLSAVPYCLIVFKII